MSNLLQKVTPFYYDPHFILHYGCFALYPVLRLIPGLFNFDDSQPGSWFGLSKEYQIYVMLATAIIAKFRKSINREAFFVDIVLYLRLSILALCYFGHSRALSWYIIAFIVFGFMVKRELYRGPSKVIPLTEISLQDVILDDFTDKVHLVLVHDPNNSRCKYFLRDFIGLSLRFTGPGIRFYSLDASRASATLRKYNIQPDQQMLLPPTIPLLSTIVNAAGLNMVSEQLPTVLCFRRGALVPDGQLPLRESGERVRALTFANMVTYFGIKDVLDASDVLKKPETRAEKRAMRGKGTKGK